MTIAVVQGSKMSVKFASYLNHFGMQGPGRVFRNLLNPALPQNQAALNPKSDEAWWRSVDRWDRGQDGPDYRQRAKHRLAAPRYLYSN